MSGEVTRLIGKKRTVDDVLSSFQKTIDELKAIVADNSTKIIKNNIRCAELTEISEDLRGEQAKAQSIANKLSKLIE